MPQTTLEEVAKRAKAIYEQRLRAVLEPTHRGWYILIEPDSGEHFLARTMADAGIEGNKKYPDRTKIFMRVGHPAAIEIGCAGA